MCQSLKLLVWILTWWRIDATHIFQTLKSDPKESLMMLYFSTRWESRSLIRFNIISLGFKCAPRPFYLGSLPLLSLTFKHKCALEIISLGADFVWRFAVIRMLTFIYFISVFAAMSPSPILTFSQLLITFYYYHKFQVLTSTCRLECLKAQRRATTYRVVYGCGHSSHLWS